MSEKMIRTDKVNNIIGLEDQTKYDKIDLFVDVTNNNNIWGLVYYTDYSERKPQAKQEIVRFQNNQAMQDYVRSHFDGYELNHPIDISQKKIFFHYVDYCDISYFYHDNKPEKNYIMIKLFEYINNTRVLQKISLPKEYEEELVNVFKISKKMPGALSPVYHHDVDVYEERANDRKEIIRSITMSIEEFFSIAGDKIKNIGHNKRLIKNLKMVMAVSAAITLLAGGYKLVTENEYNSEFMEQVNPISSVQDVGRYVNKGRIGIIIDKLVDGRYGELTSDEIGEALEFVRETEQANYDHNASYTTFSYTEYFKDKMLSNNEIDYINTSDVLYKIDNLYKKAVFVSGGKTMVNPANAQKYLDYVCSLTFMYDTYHTDRGVTYYNDGNNQDLTSPYATKKEIDAFDKLPSILKFIILNQADSLLRKVDYKVERKPLYYFKGTDKYDLLTEISTKMNSVIDSMYYQCGYSGKKI